MKKRPYHYNDSFLLESNHQINVCSLDDSMIRYIWCLLRASGTWTLPERVVGARVGSSCLVSWGGCLPQPWVVTSVRGCCQDCPKCQELSCLTLSISLKTFERKVKYTYLPAEVDKLPAMVNGIPTNFTKKSCCLVDACWPDNIVCHFKLCPRFEAIRLII